MKLYCYKSFDKFIKGTYYIAKRLSNNIFIEVVSIDGVEFSYGKNTVINELWDKADDFFLNEEQTKIFERRTNNIDSIISKNVKAPE